jgi:hypothetical protein
MNCVRCYWSKAALTTEEAKARLERMLDGPNGTTHWGRDAQLVGGYAVTLCTPCQNDWHEYVTATPEWRELLALEAQQEATKALAPGTDAEDRTNLREIMVERRLLINAAKDGLYNVAKTWMLAHENNCRVRIAANKEKEAECPS